MGNYRLGLYEKSMPGELPISEKLRAAKRAGFRKKYFSASTIAKLAMFAALAFGVSYLEFPIFPAAPFLQLDFSCVFVLLGGFMFGPVAAIIISGVKECLRLFTTSTAGIGELANFIVTVSFVLIPTLVYRFKKGLPTVIVTLVVGCLIQVGVGLLTNRYINFPLFMQEVSAAMFAHSLKALSPSAGPSKAQFFAMRSHLP